MLVDICIATYKRPALLERLLGELARQKLPNGVSTHIIVVDNDVCESARAVVAAFRNSSTSVEYLTQPVQNIALTRNRALDHSRGDVIAFIDDDESAPDGWLAALLTTMDQCAADVVLGPVHGVVPESAPVWVSQLPFFKRPSRPSGTRVDATAGGSGNALVKASAVRGRFAFDPRFGLSGGEDSDFFYRLWSDGAVMVWCQEALLTESVPDERLTLSWIVRRTFRGGQTYADIVGRPRGRLLRFVWFAKRVANVLAGGFVALCCLPFSKTAAMRVAHKVVSNIGQASTLWGYRLQEYRRPTT